MQLQAQKREKFGRQVKALRQQGQIPAELYGHGLANTHLSVDSEEFNLVFKETGENQIIDLVIDKETHKALVHGIHRNYLDGGVDHVDFYQVRMDEKTQAYIPIQLSGEAPAVKEQGGILNRTMSEVEVEALPGDLPSHFTVDLGQLKELDQSIYIKDLKVPAGVEILVEPETVIVSVSPPMKEEEIAPTAPVDVSEVKVESEEKKLERDKDKPAEEGK